jgi:hypothetical protein
MSARGGARGRRVEIIKSARGRFDRSESIRKDLGRWIGAQLTQSA